jgi:Zn finger protein HypA/HybF involved in hydrogenase expression
MLYYPKIHPDDYTREINCRECGEEFPADRRDEDDVICDKCKTEREQNENISQRIIGRIAKTGKM